MNNKVEVMFSFVTLLRKAIYWGYCLAPLIWLDSFNLLRFISLPNDTSVFIKCLVINYIKSGMYGYLKFKNINLKLLSNFLILLFMGSREI